MIALAPGTVWNTKRWPAERFAELARKLDGEGYTVALVGGAEDRPLCDAIVSAAAPARIFTAAGALSLLRSAELIRRCQLLVSNDSAPMHLGVAVGTPVVALFGATVPEFGFAPYGPKDLVVEIRGLSCRPCSSHGGARCPINTFDCMLRISADRVAATALGILRQAQQG
jgi:heptosyltransferase-2